MNKATMLLIVIWVALLAALPITANAATGVLFNGDRYTTDKVIVGIACDAPRLATDNSVAGIAVTGNESIDRLCGRLGVISVEPFYRGRLTKPSLIREVSRLYIFTLAENIDAADVLNDFRADAEIEMADLSILPELCYEPDDPRYDDQWYLRHISAHLAWDTVRGDTTSHAVVGIVDTGLRWEHPDLAPNIWVNSAEDVNQNGIFDLADNDNIDADSNGFVDDVVGWDFGDSDNGPIDDVTLHGTPVAGCVSEATDNDFQGAAVGFSTRLMAIKIFASNGMPNNAYQGIVYAAETGAQVINCSWRYGSYSEIEQNLITAAWQAGALIVAAAAAFSSDEEVFPAAYEHVLAVAATDQTDHKTSFSSYGVWIDLSAPGVDIWTTTGNADFGQYSGTSFSAALVSGFAALIRAWNPSLTPDETEELMETTSDQIDSINPGYAGRLGAGRINCANWLTTPVFEQPDIPGKFALAQNYPNPFNARTVISYFLPAKTNVTIDVYNILGERVGRLAGGSQEAGPHEITWDASGQVSGIYFYRLSAGDFSDVRRCLLLK